MDLKEYCSMVLQRTSVHPSQSGEEHINSNYEMINHISWRFLNQLSQNTFCSFDYPL